MRTLTDKILGYLIFQHELSGKQKFKIPLNRQEFADYLYVNRTSLSSALSSMQRRGIIELKNNRFTILNPLVHV